MPLRRCFTVLAAVAVLSVLPTIGHAADAPGPSPSLVRQMEELDRGVVALDPGNGRVFVGWRLLGTDAEDVGFNLYRTSGGRTEKVNAAPLEKAGRGSDGVR